jgi:hypothetical protein
MVGMTILGFIVTGVIKSDKLDKGDPMLLTNGIDYDGRICGATGGVKKRGNAYYMATGAGNFHICFCILMCTFFIKFCFIIWQRFVLTSALMILIILSSFVTTMSKHRRTMTPKLHGNWLEMASACFTSKRSHVSFFDVYYLVELLYC